VTSRSAPITIETTQTLDTMLHQVLNQALVAIDAKAGSLMLVAARQGILQIKARLGPPRPGRVTERVFSVDDNSIAGLVVRRKRSYLCHDVDHDDFFLRSRSGRNFTSLLSVPIVHDGRVIAVINADSERRRRFTDDDRRLLESVAQKVAGPIADRISITDALAEVGVELTRLPREGGVDRVLDKISDLAVRSLGADVVTLYQYDEETDEFPVEGIGPAIGGTIRDRRAMRRKISPGDVPWTVVKERRPGFYVNVHEEEFLVGKANRPGRRPQPRFVEREGIRSMAALLLPFRAAESEDEEVVGVMFANYKTRHTFNIDEMSALKTFADYASVAILNARYEERRRTDQIRMVESISANLAHRMSNLAGPSRPAVELLRERVDPADELAHRQLDTIERKADLLMDLASQLVRRIKEAGSIVEIEPVPLEPLISDELSRIDPDRGRVVVHRDVPPGLPRVQTIEYQLRQVLGDLLDNAVAAVADLPRGDISVTARRNDLTKRVEIEVSDNGAGIPDEIRNGLFTAGVSTKRDTLGIGLWYGRAFLQATGGDLRLASTGPGEGTTFLIEVPVAKEERRGTAGGTPASPRPEILIVENEADWRSAMTDALAGQGYRLTVATTHAEAAALLASTPFALAILDLSLHDDPHNRDGLELLEHIDELRLDTRAIIVTGHGDEDDRQVARRSPRFVEMVHKDGFSVPAFRALVDRLVRGGATPAADGRRG
jgi:signal transduction histidine kinase/CheY-like chemotaxis protein